MMTDSVDQAFTALLRAYREAEGGAERQAAEDRLWDAFGVEGAVYVQDMSGFSRLTLKYGIVHYLGMIVNMRETVRPIIERFDGSLVKFEADNCYGRYPDTVNAVEAAIEINRALEALNQEVAPDEQIRVSGGIDYGRFLMAGEDDFFGSPVNLASKLGEDIAGPGDILVTRDAWERVAQERRPKSEACRFSVSGVDLVARKILY